MRRHGIGHALHRHQGGAHDLLARCNTVLLVMVCGLGRSESIVCALLAYMVISISSNISFPTTPRLHLRIFSILRLICTYHHLLGIVTILSRVGSMRILALHVPVCVEAG